MLRIKYIDILLRFAAGPQIAENRFLPRPLVHDCLWGSQGSEGQDPVREVNPKRYHGPDLKPGFGYVRMGNVTVPLRRPLAILFCWWQLV